MATHRAYFQYVYDREIGRWRWTIIVNTANHQKEVARSIPTYPTEHDANRATKDVQRQLQPAAKQVRR